MALGLGLLKICKDKVSDSLEQELTIIKKNIDVEIPH